MFKNQNETLLTFNENDTFFCKWYDVVCLHISFLIIPCLVVFDCFLYLLGGFWGFFGFFFCLFVFCLFVCLFVFCLFVFFPFVFFYLLKEKMFFCLFLFSFFFVLVIFMRVGFFGVRGFIEDACLHLLCYNL